MKKLLLIALLVSNGCLAHAESIQFLEPTTVFCYSQQNLAEYLRKADQRDLDGLNQLVLAGKCDFVPDGDIIRLGHFRDLTLESRPIIAFENKNQTLWTFKALVKKVQLSNL